MQTLRKGGEEMRLKDAGEIYGLVTLVIVLIGGLIVAFLERCEQPPAMGGLKFL